MFRYIPAGFLKALWIDDPSRVEVAYSQSLHRASRPFLVHPLLSLSSHWLRREPIRPDTMDYAPGSGFPSSRILTGVQPGFRLQGFDLSK